MQKALNKKVKGKMQVLNLHFALCFLNRNLSLDESKIRTFLQYKL